MTGAIGIVEGRLVLEDRIAAGRLIVEDGRIAAIHDFRYVPYIGQDAAIELHAPGARGTRDTA